MFKIGSNQTYICKIKTAMVSMKSHPNACVICCDQEKDCVYLPCKHNTACIKCSKNLKECPICRVKIEDYVRIYRSWLINTYWYNHYVGTFNFKRKNRSCLPLSSGQQQELQGVAFGSLPQGKKKGLYETLLSSQELRKTIVLYQGLLPHLQHSPLSQRKIIHSWIINHCFQIVPRYEGSWPGQNQLVSIILCSVFCQKTIGTSFIQSPFQKVVGFESNIKVEYLPW